MLLRAPQFWFTPNVGPVALFLNPISKIITRITRHRLKQHSPHVLIPVLCCGNVTVGGTGKTPLTLDLVERAKKRGYRPHILSRGYKRRSHDIMKVDLNSSTARDVGDEPLLLAQAAPTWVGANRSKTAELAVSDGANCLFLDDGLQNPTLHKDVSILVIDGPSGFGNKQIIPSGPLREPIEDILKRVQVIVILGEDKYNLSRSFPKTILVTHAKIIPGPEIRHFLGQRVIAFAGIGKPDKFFNMLQDAGVNPIRCLPFPDHHTYSQSDIRRLENLRKESGTTLVTTAKDAVKLPASFRSKVVVVNIELFWQDPTAPDRILDLLFTTTT